jgi:hypothetical protein
MEIKNVTTSKWAPLVFIFVGFTVGVVAGYQIRDKKGKLNLRKRIPAGEYNRMVKENQEFDIEALRKAHGITPDMMPPVGSPPGTLAGSRAEFDEEIKGLVTPDEDITVSIRPVPNEDTTGAVVRVDEPIPPRPHKDENVVHHVFAGPSVDPWDYDEEVAKRTEDAPYILHRDEFYAEEKGYIQVTLTYYEGDNVMTDEDDSPVYNYEVVVGPLKFGHGCDDPNVFHVRNDTREAEYEILRDRGFYSIEVLGLEHEKSTDPNEEKHLKHSEDHVRRFRSED